MRNHKDPARQEQLLSYSDSGAHGCAIATTKRISKRYNCAQISADSATRRCASMESPYSAQSGVLQYRGQLVRNTDAAASYTQDKDSFSAQGFRHSVVQHRLPLRTFCRGEAKLRPTSQAADAKSDVGGLKTCSSPHEEVSGVGTHRQKTPPPNDP